ncbi:MAG: hypothetical protein QOG14_3696 [Mycobacterium sp.]|jgi:phosphotransferase system HPr-like phosphotransfer protein|nr:hypothetical protein [Mycobacterium sp.]
MAYLKPPWFTAKVFNRIAMATGISNTETLTVTKRGSKEQQAARAFDGYFRKLPDPADHPVFALTEKA